MGASRRRRPCYEDGATAALGCFALPALRALHGGCQARGGDRAARRLLSPRGSTRAVSTRTPYMGIGLSDEAAHENELRLQPSCH